MIIIGIDPGYERMGIAVLEKPSRGKEKLLYSDCIRTPKTLPHSERLLLLGDEVEKVINDYSPELMAIESLFFNENQKTVMPVSEARGVVMYIAAKEGVDVREFTPIEIKVAVTGYGRADKKQMTQMLQRLLDIQKRALDDEYDAMAVAITGSAHFRRKAP
jgi:crossover junction endodeoxyribonuclease RuvC